MVEKKAPQMLDAIAVSGRTVLEGRNGSIDLLRFGAAIGVVWFHAGASGAGIGFAGLTIFLELTVILSLLNDKGRPMIALARARIDRLIRPWLVWSLIYALAKIAQAAMLGEQIRDEFSPYMIATGSALHLWFLPYVAVFGLTGLALARQFRGLAAVILVALFSLPLAVVLQRAAQDVIPFAQWANGLGAVSAGWAIAIALRDRAPLWIVILSFAMSAVVGFALQGGLGGPVLSWIIGTLVTSLALLFPVNSSRFSVWLGQMSLPVYLIHPMASSLLDKFISLTPGASAASAVAFSLLAGMVLSRGRLGRALF